MRITILGGGSWGSALAIHLVNNGHQVKVWEFFAEQAQIMQETRINPLLPKIKLPKAIEIYTNMQESLQEAEIILLAVPSDKVEATINNAKEFVNDQPIIICSKGFGNNLRLLSEIVASNVKGEVLCLYGPTHAEEVCREIFSGIVLAGKNSEKLSDLFSSDYLRVETTTDIIGVQVAAALKNILAVFIGVLSSAKLGDNTKAYVITKGLAEIKQVGTAMGGQEETFYGLAGLGDVIVTTMSEHSRNRHVGMEIGKGKNLQEVLDEMKMVAEGVSAAKNIPLLQKKYTLKLPILGGLYDLLFKDKKLEQVLKEI